MQIPQLPQENIEIFSLLYAIETVLRELIIERLSSVEGSKWYKKCLPSDILDKYKDSRNQEKRTPWLQCIPHHPIYYLDFPHLRMIIQRNDNWKVFDDIFFSKEILVSTLWWPTLSRHKNRVR